MEANPQKQILRPFFCAKNEKKKGGKGFKFKKENMENKPSLVVPKKQGKLVDSKLQQAEEHRKRLENAKRLEEATAKAEQIKKYEDELYEMYKTSQ